MVTTEELEVEGRLFIVVVVVMVGRTSACRSEGVKVITPESGLAPWCKVGVFGA